MTSRDPGKQGPLLTLHSDQGSVEIQDGKDDGSRSPDSDYETSFRHFELIGKDKNKILFNIIILKILN